MADPTATFNHPFDENQCTDDILMFDESPNLDLAELPLFKEPDFSHPSIPQSSNDIGYPNDPLVDPFVWGMYEHFAGGSQVGPSEIRGETNRKEENQQPQNSESGNPMQLSIWPVPPVPYCCTCCQVLREITHTNGFHFTKLEIHGRLGMICHCILENRYGGDWIAGPHDYQMFDFCKKSIESVKEFLVQYCEERKQAGYFMLQDPLLIFYEALCVGLNEDKNLDFDDFLRFSPIDSGEFEMNDLETMNQPEAESNVVLPPKSTMAAQRERTGKLTLKDFIEYFHLPIDDAAKKMNICPTVMKKICRKHGLLRWPYRKIKSIERKISARRAILNSNDAEERARAQTDIERLQHELANIFAGFCDL